jgi:hypothetical protein
MTQEDFLAQIAEHLEAAGISDELDELLQAAEKAQRPPAP